MTTPTSLKFATDDDVADRFEGKIPADRSEWVTTRIGDVENQLMGLVPSLRKPLADITADNEAAGDPGRLARVKALVCDKVLDLYRNPNKAISSESQTFESDSFSRTYAGAWRGAASAISFTDAELDTVKLRKRRRGISIIPVAPWGVPCS